MLSQPVNKDWNGFIYIISGAGRFGPSEAAVESDAHHTLVLGPGDHVEVENTVSQMCGLHVEWTACRVDCM